MGKQSRRTKTKASQRPPPQRGKHPPAGDETATASAVTPSPAPGRPQTRSRSRNGSVTDTTSTSTRPHTRSQLNSVPRASGNTAPSASGNPAPRPVANTAEVEAEMIRNGTHPVSGLQMRTCACPAPDDCRKIMWRYAAIGGKAMFPYLRLPGEPKKKDSATGHHVSQYRDNVFHHLLGFGSNDVQEEMPGGRYVSLIHFDPRIRDFVIERSNGKGGGGKKVDKWRVPLDIGRACGLTKRDLCKVSDSKGNIGDFMASPAMRLGDARAEIAEGERDYKIRRAAMDPSSVPSPPRGGRKGPKERELDTLTREAQANPLAIAIRLQDTEVENQALKAELAKMKKEYEARGERHKKEMEELNDRLTSELLLTGLSRRSLLSEKYHEKKKWVSKHFYGRPWKEHKARGRALFGGFVDNFDDNVTGEEPFITPFEKYSMCCMIAWRGFTQPTVGSIYDRDRSRISRYMKEWMPLLGQAGADCSELDLEMNHNFMSVDFLKEHGLPYLIDGVWYDLDEGNGEKE